MAMTVGEITAYLDLNDRGFNSKIDNAEKRFGKLGQTLTRTGAMMTAAVTAPIVAGMALAVKGASDLEESVNKVDVVFGKSAESIRKWSEGSAEAMGQSKAQALEAVGTFGNLFVAMGTGEDEAAKMSTSLVELASDLASFNNTTVDEALLALRSGMVGETEPLKRFGVAMNEATLKAEAMALGLDTTGATLDPLVKQQAAYSLIMKQTTTAQGDFARTADGLANSTKIASAELKDLAATLGKDLIPMAKDLLGIIKPILSTFSGMPGPVRKLILLFAGLAAATGPVMMMTGGVLQVYDRLGGKLPRVGGGIRGITKAMGSYIAKVPAIIAANVALVASFAVVAAGIMAIVWAYMEWQKAAAAAATAAANAQGTLNANAANLDPAFVAQKQADIERDKYRSPQGAMGWLQAFWEGQTSYGFLRYVPGLANEGVVKASPGGTVVRLGEGGEDEAVVKTSRLKGRSIVVNLNFNAPVVGGKAGLRELSRMVQGDVMAGVQRGMVGQNG